MGYIERPYQFLYLVFESMPSRLGLLFDITARNLERVIYYENHLVIDPWKTPLEERQLTEQSSYRLKMRMARIPLLPVWEPRLFEMLY